MSPNSKKCSTARVSLRASARLALAFATLCALNLSSPHATAATHLAPTLFRADLKARNTSSFEGLIRRWETRYGADAVQPLLSIASDKASEDADRYIAILAAAKLGGPSSAPMLTSYLKDSSWMIRSAALKALSALQNPQTAPAVLPALQDPALVVRLEAVYAAETLRPEGVVEALLATLKNKENYHRGKAQWVPQRALQALVKLKATDAAPKLRPLLDHQDLAFRKDVVDTLDELRTQRAPAAQSSKSLQARVAAWKSELDRK